MRRTKPRAAGAGTRPAPQASTEAEAVTRLVLGVIGHVDHGKTALVRALTGMETDRLPEEKRRGISIALGFAHTVLETGAAVDLIDMPGHERFVRTMVSGATGIGAVLLVVAADEGIKPQTVEHVDIAALLGLRRAVIAVTKADLVDADTAAVVARQASGLVAAAGLVASAPVLTSAATGLGLAALRRAAAGALRDHPAPVDGGVPWLPIDRVFSVVGQGTVVTGTLRRGTLSTGDEIELTPPGLPVRVRGMQVHGANVTSAKPGQRVAVNLRGVEATEVPRGAALAGRGLLPASAWLSLEVHAAAGAAPLRDGAQLRLLLGTTEAGARLRLLDRKELAPGEAALAQLHCLAPVAVPARERCILRVASPARTVAGGLILDPEATRLRRHDPGVLARLSALVGASSCEILAREVARAGHAGLPLGRLARLSGLSPARAAELLQTLPIILGRSRTAVMRPVFEALLADVPRCLAPYLDGLSREALGTASPGVGRMVLDDAISHLVGAGVLRQEGGFVRLRHPDTEQARVRQELNEAGRLAELLRRAGLHPPDAESVAPDPSRRRLVERLVREGTVIRATDRVQKREVLFHRDAVEAAKRCLAPLLAQPLGLLVGEAGAALGVSRKFSVPLLEHLDAVQFTRRIGDRRGLMRDD